MPNLNRTARVLVSLLVVSLPGTGSERHSVAVASPGPVLRIVDASDATKTTPVVNERGKLALKVVDASGNAVAVQSWSTDNKSVGKVSRKGLLRGKAYGFATVTAQTAQGPVSGFVVVARVTKQTGAKVQGDTKADTGGNVYLSSPQHDAIFRASGLSADVFAGALDQSGYAEGSGSEIRFDGPAGLGVDNRAEGGLYVADTANDCIRKIDFRGRSSLAVGTPRVAGVMEADETPMSEAVMSGPRGVAMVGSSMIVTDTENDCIWYADVQRGVVQLVAGEPGQSGLANGVGRAARFDHPSGIAINTRGTLLAVADTGNNVIRLVGLTARDGGGVVGEVTTLGQASSARGAHIAEKLAEDKIEDTIAFDAPESVAFDGVDNVYVVDSQSASVVTRPPAASGRPVERVDLAQVGTLGSPASVTVRRTQAYVLDDAAQTEHDAVKLVEVGPPAITSVTPDEDGIEGGAPVIVTGANFAPESVVALGDAEVLDLRVESSTRIRFVVPPQQTAGIRTLSVLTRGGVAQFPFRIRLKSLAELEPGEITTVVSPTPYAGDGAIATDPRVRFTARAMAIDGAGNIYIADPVVHRIRRVDASTGIITTVAGTGTQGYTGDGGPAIAATFRSPNGVAVDAAGNLIIADTNNLRIRRVDAVSGIITTIAGSGVQGSGGDGGPALAAQFMSPVSVAVDGAGNVFVTDAGDLRIRKVDAATGTISTVAGNGQEGYTGDGGLATQATFGGLAHAVAVDAAGDLFVSDTLNFCVRRVDAQTHVIETIAGIGRPEFSGDGGPAAAAGLAWAGGLSLDGAGNLYVADRDSQRVRRIDAASRVITSVAGSGKPGFGGDGGPATAARLNGPRSVVADGLGNLVIDDWANSRVRRVDATTHVIETIAGGEPFLGDGGPAIDAVLFQPESLVIDGADNLYIADAAHGRVRLVEAETGRISTVAGNDSPVFTGEGRLATKSGILDPFGVAADSAGDIFIAIDVGQRVLRVDARSKILSIAAGNGTADPITGVGTYSGDGGPAVEAGLNLPLGVAVDGAGNVYIADTYNDRIRRVDRSGVITTFAGGGVPGDDGGVGDGGPATAASLSIPYAIAFDAAGNLLIADSGNARVRRVDAATGIITTVAGTGERGSDGDGGPATSARLGFPRGLAFDGAGNLFIADQVGARVRRVDTATHVITTVVGTGEHRYSGDGGPATNATLGRPSGVAVDHNGNLFITDAGNNAVRAIKGIAVPR